jgi:penicillin-binding protein 1A
MARLTASPTAGGRTRRPARRTKAPRRRAPSRGLLRRLARTALIWSVVAGLWAMIAVGGLLAWQAYTLPDIRDLDRYTRSGAVRLADADGRMFASFGPLHGDPVTVDRLPPHLVQAVLATEDRRFYSHFGVDPIGLARAAWSNLRAGRVVQGGSTLTQQLAKNVFLTPDRSFERKIQELLLAFWLERNFTKDEILAIYLNRVYFGAGAYGVDAAARKYFGIPATRLGLAESALLAGQLKAPTRLNPAVAPERAGARASVVLAAMVEAGYIDRATARAAAAEPITLAGPAGRGDGARYLADAVRDSLPDFVGHPGTDLDVTTTLDPGLQALAERAVTEGLAAAPGGGAGLQAALVALDPATAFAGRPAAWVRARSPFTAGRGFPRGTGRAGTIGTPECAPVFACRRLVATGAVPPRTVVAARPIPGVAPRALASGRVRRVLGPLRAEAEGLELGKVQFVEILGRIFGGGLVFHA